MLELLDKNPEWRVLDLGSGTDGWKSATIYADCEDCHSSYPDGNFVQTDASSTPFKDKEFDFVAATHIAEHVEDPFKFCKELERIAKRGYIEVPTPFFDNLIEGNSNPPPHGHVWWVNYDDVKDELVFQPRLAILQEILEPADTTRLLPLFKDVMVTRVYWENTIQLRQDELIFTYVAGNSDPKRVLDLRNKELPPDKMRLGR